MTTIYNLDNDNLSLLKKTNTTLKDLFWYNDFSILFKYSRLDEFFPSKDMTIEEQLNSIVRLSFYISIILVIYTKNINNLYITIIVLLFTYFAYTKSDYNNKFINISNKSNDLNSDLNKKKFVAPTKNNPFMNIMIDDYKKNPNRESLNKANNYINNKLNKQISEKFNHNLYSDFDKIYNVKNAQRQFYTTPVTTIPNEQSKFANWLYKTPPTCKEGNGIQCSTNNFNFLKDSKIRNGIF